MLGFRAASVCLSVSQELEAWNVVKRTNTRLIHEQISIWWRTVACDQMLQNKRRNEAWLVKHRAQLFCPREERRELFFPFFTPDMKDQENKHGHVNNASGHVLALTYLPVSGGDIISCWGKAWTWCDDIVQEAAEETLPFLCWSQVKPTQKWPFCTKLTHLSGSKVITT